MGAGGTGIDWAVVWAWLALLAACAALAGGLKNARIAGTTLRVWLGVIYLSLGACVWAAVIGLESNAARSSDHARVAFSLQGVSFLASDAAVPPAREVLAGFGGEPESGNTDIAVVTAAKLFARLVRTPDSVMIEPVHPDLAADFTAFFMAGTKPLSARTVRDGSALELPGGGAQCPSLEWKSGRLRAEGLRPGPALARNGVMHRPNKVWPDGLGQLSEVLPEGFDRPGCAYAEWWYFIDREGRLALWRDPASASPDQRLEALIVPLVDAAATDATIERCATATRLGVLKVSRPFEGTNRMTARQLVAARDVRLARCESARGPSIRLGFVVPPAVIVARSDLALWHRARAAETSFARAQPVESGSGALLRLEGVGQGLLNRSCEVIAVARDRGGERYDLSWLAPARQSPGEGLALGRDKTVSGVVCPPFAGRAPTQWHVQLADRQGLAVPQALRRGGPDRIVWTAPLQAGLALTLALIVVCGRVVRACEDSERNIPAPLAATLVFACFATGFSALVTLQSSFALRIKPHEVTGALVSLIAAPVFVGVFANWQRGVRHWIGLAFWGGGALAVLVAVAALEAFDRSTADALGSVPREVMSAMFLPLASCTMAALLCIGVIWAIKTGARLDAQRLVWVVGFGFLALVVARLGLRLANSPESIDLLGVRLQHTLWQLPVLAALWAVWITGPQDRTRPRVSWAVTGLGVLASLSSLLAGDSGAALVNGVAILGAVGLLLWQHRRIGHAVATGALSFLGLGLVILVPVLGPPAYAALQPVLGWVDKSETASNRAIVIMAPEEAARIGTSKVDEELAAVDENRYLASGPVFGRGFLDRPSENVGIGRYHITDRAAIFQIISPFGRAYAWAWLAMLALVAVSAPVPSSPGTGRALATTALFTLLYGGFYMLLACLEVVFFTGRNMPFLAVDSGADLTESLALLTLAAIGFGFASATASQKDASS